ncbi:hypothetical protein CM19_02895 [Candidatus Acidianus copahuensis]|uniref:Uncharacterized protein n=1 Tax=Candidatus Acidianus copahuensis TaxID=1160895 RepID=A0A031LQY7_9CREN|nr:hypothetical protein [Candidatus Acidianus copahuensis]EZQ10797.1 hypothetical protein CM19_02895 [Candidatus Acidianus copahuensis]
MEKLSIDTGVKQTFPQDMRVGSALSHIVAAASIVEELEGESEDVDLTVIKYVDAWINEMLPINYKPGLAEVLGSKIKKKLTGIFPEISENELGTTLDEAIEVKNSIEHGEIIYDYADLEVRIERVLRSLGVDINYFSNYLETNNFGEKVNNLLSLLVLTIGIAAVRKKWTAELQ